MYGQSLGGQRRNKCNDICRSLVFAMSPNADYLAPQDGEIDTRNKEKQRQTNTQGGCYSRRREVGEKCFHNVYVVTSYYKQERETCNKHCKVKNKGEHLVRQRHARRTITNEQEVL